MPIEDHGGQPELIRGKTGAGGRGRADPDPRRHELWRRLVPAQQAGAAEIVDPSPYAVGSIKQTYENYPNARKILPGDGLRDASRFRSWRRRSTPPTPMSSSKAPRSISRGSCGQQADRQCEL